MIEKKTRAYNMVETSRPATSTRTTGLTDSDTIGKGVTGTALDRSSDKKSKDNSPAFGGTALSSDSHAKEVNKDNIMKGTFLNPDESSKKDNTPAFSATALDDSEFKKTDTAFGNVGVDPRDRYSKDKNTNFM